MHKGYTHIYDDLIAIWSREAVWDAGLGLAGLFYLLVFTYLAWSPDPLITPMALGLLVLALIPFLYLWLIVALGISASLDPQKEVGVLSVRIMTAVPHPYHQKGCGLGYRDLRHLRRIAEIEQGAADWRGSFVSFVIIGTISVVVWVVPYIRGIFNELQITGTAQSPPPDIEPGWSVTGLAILTLFIIVYLGIVFLIGTMATYFRRFLAGEAANRVILKACEESLAFLEKYDLRDRTSFSLREKRAIAAHFGCKIVMEDDASWADKLWTWGFEPDGTIWRLVPPARHSRVQDMRLKLRGARMWLRSKRFRKPHQ
ncbi:MAG: hypothetical protein K1X50_12905 [Candidatus Promineofilum sp.]|nr:hypothetical protein [Promineifilum sp.]